jgi:predicted small lipoprotein YifL
VRTRLAWLTVALAAVLTLAACGGGSGSDGPRSATPTAAPQRTDEAEAQAPSDTELLTRLLQARATAIEAGDSGAYLATATGATQRRRDRRAIAAARRLPLRSVGLSARSTEITGDRAVLRVVLRYAFSGVDTVYYKTSRVAARRTASGWRVASDRPTYGAVAPWEHRTYVARRSRHFLALTPKGLQAKSLMRDLEAGRTRMRQGLPGVTPPKRVLVIVARTGADTRALTKDITTLRSLVAVAETQYSTTGPAKRIAEVWGERVFVLWSSYAGRSESGRQTVIAHELTHTALAKRTSARTPPWLTEGIALYASGDDRAGEAGALLSGRGYLSDPADQAAARRAMSLGRLSRVRALRNLSSAGLSFAYAYAAAAAYTIAEQHGQEALLRVLRAYGSERYRGTGRTLTDRILRRTLKTSLKTFEAQVRAYATAHSRF